MPLDFNGKLAVVTGGANGIGLAAARSLAAGGARVWIFDLERERPEEIGRSLGGHGCGVDVTDRTSIDAAFEQSGAPDILVANAGMAVWAPLDETPADAWNRTIALNLSGVFHTVQAAAVRMKPRKRGAIVITASTNSYDGEATMVAYKRLATRLHFWLRTSHRLLQERRWWWTAGKWRRSSERGASRRPNSRTVAGGCAEGPIQV
jgi:NAD(P)-dependent dehydrogenase (short-subunit alcohol dehydrogenase family)